MARVSSQDIVSLTNNMRWHMAYAIDGYTNYPSSNLYSRLNRLSTMISIVTSVFKTYYSAQHRDPVEYMRFKVAVRRLTLKRSILRRSYVPIIEQNPYLWKWKAQYEEMMDDLQDDIYFLVNTYGLTGGYSSANLVTSLGQRKVPELALPLKTGQKDTNTGD